MIEWEMAQVKRAVPTEYDAKSPQESQPRAYKPHPSASLTQAGDAMKD
jgi:hypothetical protein